MLLVVVAGILSPIAPALATRCMPSAATPCSANLMGISTRSATIRIYMPPPDWRRWPGSSFPFIPRRAMRWRASASSWMRDCLGGDRRYAAKRWRRYRAGNAVRGGDPGADSDLHQLRRHPQLMVDENAIGILLFIFIALQRGLTVLWEKSAKCGGDAGERGGESLRNAPPAGAGGAGRTLRRPGTL